MFEHFSQRTWSILTIFKQPTFSLFLPDCCQFDPKISANLGWQWLLLAQRRRRARAGSVRLGLYGFKIFGLQDVVVDVLSRLRGHQRPRVAGSPMVSGATKCSKCSDSEGLILEIMAWCFLEVPEYERSLEIHSQRTPSFLDGKILHSEIWAWISRFQFTDTQLVLRWE